MKMAPASAVKFDSKHLWRVAFLCVAVWYGAACGVHYFSQRSLWNDEVAVLDSIRSLKPSELFTMELRAAQVFPHLYLFCIQSFAKPFGNSIFSLRFLPFVCMMAAFILWLRIARRELKEPLSYLTFMMCWIASAPLIYYSAELKQYSMDVLASAVFLTFLYAQHTLRARLGDVRYMTVMALLPASVMLSYAAYFFLVFPLWNLAAAVRNDRSQTKFLLVYMCSLVLFAACSYQFDMRLRPVEAVTGGFMDYFISTVSIKDFFQTLGEAINNIVSRWFVELPKGFRAAARFFMLFGLVSLFTSFFKNISKTGWRFVSVPTVALAVFVELIIVGIMQKYPIGVPRTVLFFSPMLLLLTVQGICSLKKFNRYVYYAVHGTFLIYLSVVAVGLFGVILTEPIDAIPTIWAF